MAKKIRITDLLVILAAVLLAAFFAFRWLAENRMPYGSFLLFLSLQYTELLKSGDLSGLLHQLFAPGFYPPLYEFSMGVLHSLLGFSRTNAVILNYLSIAVAAVSCYGIGLFIAGRRAGILAALLLLLYPGIFLCARTALNELALVGPAALCVFMLYCSDRFKNRWAVLLFAFSFVTGMYIKWNLFLVVVSAVILFFGWTIASGLKEKVSARQLGLEREQWINIIISGVLIFLLLAPWYLGSLQWDWIGKATHTEPVVTFGLFHWISYNAAAINRNGMHIVFFICLLLGFVAAALWPQRKRTALVFAWFFGGYFLFTLIPHKQFRYLLPLLPAAAILTAVGIEILKTRWLKISVSVLLVVYGLFQFYQITYREPIYADPTGNTLPGISTKCQQAPEREFKKLMNLIRPYAEGDRPIQLATHPFNQDGPLWNDEIIYYYMEVEKYRGQGVSIVKPGYAPLMYDMFYQDLNKNRVDILLVENRLFSATLDQLIDQVNVWRNNDTLHEKNLNVPDNDPGLFKKIETEFSFIGKIESECFPTLRILKRN